MKQSFLWGIPGADASSKCPHLLCPDAPRDFLLPQLCFKLALFTALARWPCCRRKGYLLFIIAATPINYNQMTDKFEIKDTHNAQSCLLKLGGIKKPSLLEYKQVILQLSQAVNDLAAENDKLKNEISLLSSSTSRQTELLRLEKAKNEQLTKTKQQLDEKLRLLKQNVQNSHKEMSKSDERVKQLLKSNAELTQKIDMYTEKMQTSERLYAISAEKIRMLEESLNEAFEQNRNIKLEAHHNRKYNQEQIKDLIQFNQQLKKRFDAMKITQNKILDDHQISSLNFKVVCQKQKRSFSTEKKQKRNIGCLSSATQFFKRTDRYNRLSQQNPYSEAVKPFQLGINPELNEQLQNLKKEIAQQYTLIGIQNESYSKQKVSRTLEELRKRMGRAIEIAQQSQSQC